MCNTRLCSLKIALASFIERKSHSEFSGINKHLKYFSIIAHLMKWLSIIRSRKSASTKEQAALFEIGSTFKRKATTLTNISECNTYFPRFVVIVVAAALRRFVIAISRTGIHCKHRAKTTRECASLRLSPLPSDQKATKEARKLHQIGTML